MTERVYLNDVRAQSCTATVKDCREAEGDAGKYYETLLDRTVIFPESGGQLSDAGAIDGHAVTHAREDGEDVWHRCTMRFEAGTEVTVTLDIQPRLDHSQQHTGEHMLSGLASSMFGAKNVGFHMAEDYSTLDLDAYLDEEQLTALECAANEAVRQNLPVKCTVVTEDELATLTLRKKASGLAGDNIRIVYVGDVDSCTCCGTHCVQTGEVGFIRIQDAIRYKGGTRVWFLCGGRAVASAREDRLTLRRLAARFSTGDGELMQAVLRQGDELTATRHTLRLRTDALLTNQAEALLSEAESTGGMRIVICRTDGLDMNELKLLAEKLRAEDDAVALLFSSLGGTLYYQLARGKGAACSMKELCAAVNAAMGGKGGGRDDFAQGSAKDGPGQMEALEQLKRYVYASLKGAGAKA